MSGQAGISRRHPLAVGLVVAMALGSVALWLGIPIGWIWVASMLSDSSQPSLGPYMLIIVAVPLSMAAMGKLLGYLNRTYGRITGTVPEVHITPPWMRSMRGERKVERPRTILDVVMVGSVSIALVAMAIWFMFFAGSPLPQ